ncbi:hypothetical protein SAMN05443662_1407 [Sulfurivirga caldicuralii]|uniref:Cds6 C-terminal domain-containing protein n=1 Tax=Sulfurivirga caldicuralii TaxID=364032 RepID=A0A1N6GME8_9GAMM|nr:nuclear transport factor 2 family protein [Sulfurivirga caldicuralii]SIO08622.1 hypothetical protein SAMN05443662_1407 [Sulfurivirga caldicuralii]
MKTTLFVLFLLFSLAKSATALAAEKADVEKVGDPPYGELQALVKKGLFVRAKTLLEKTRAQWPKQVWHANMGAVLIRLGKMEAAGQHLEAALMADARSATIWQMLKGVRSYQARAAYKELFPKAAGPQRVAIKLVPPPPAKKVAVAQPAKTSPSQVKPEPLPVPATATADKSVPAETAAAKAEAPQQSAAVTKMPPADLRAALEAWRAAWSAQNVAAYLKAYAEDFHAPGMRDHAQWVQQRRLLISKPDFIRVSLQNIQWKAVDAQRWQVRFKQVYESNLFRDQVLKRLEWQQQPNGWKITKEEVVR